MRIRSKELIGKRRRSFSSPVRFTAEFTLWCLADLSKLHVFAQNTTEQGALCQIGVTWSSLTSAECGEKMTGSRHQEQQGRQRGAGAFLKPFCRKSNARLNLWFETARPLHGGKDTFSDARTSVFLTGRLIVCLGRAGCLWICFSTKRIAKCSRINILAFNYSCITI